MKAVDIEVGNHVRVRFTQDPKDRLEAQVTAICIRQGGYRSFEVTWCHNGEIKTAWVTSDSLHESPGDEKVVGFGGR